MVDSSFRGITVGVAGRNPDALGAPLRREGWMVKRDRIATRTRDCGLARSPAHHMSVESCTNPRQGPVRSGWRCQLFSQVGSGGDYGCGRCAPTGKIDEDGRSSRRFSRKGESTGRPFAVLGAKLASGQGAWRVPRAGARSGHRTCCWARPGSRRWGTMKRRVASGSRGPRLVGWIGCPALDRVGDVPASTCPPGKVQ